MTNSKYVYGYLWTTKVDRIWKQLFLTLISIRKYQIKFEELQEKPKCQFLPEKCHLCVRKRRKNQVRSYVLTRVDFLGTISREVVFPWNSIHLQVKTQQVNNISCKIYLNLSTIFCVTYTAYTARCDSTGKEAFSSSKEFLAVVDLIAGAHLGNNMHRQNIS